MIDDRPAAVIRGEILAKDAYSGRCNLIGAFFGNEIRPKSTAPAHFLAEITSFRHHKTLYDSIIKNCRNSFKRGLATKLKRLRHKPACYTCQMISSSSPNSCLTVRSYASSRTISPGQHEGQSGANSENVEISQDGSSNLAEESPVVEQPKSDETQRKRGRKGHSKSRTGCFNCKKARIKVLHNSFFPAVRTRLNYIAVQGKSTIM